VVKNLYLIYVLSKNSIFLEIFLQYSTHFCIISLKKYQSLLKNSDQK